MYPAKETCSGDACSLTDVLEFLSYFPNNEALVPGCMEISASYCFCSYACLAIGLLWHEAVRWVQSLFDSTDALCAFTRQYFLDVISHDTDVSSSGYDGHVVVSGLARVLAMAASIDGSMNCIYFLHLN